MRGFENYPGEVLLKGQEGNVTISIVLKGEHGGVSDVSNANSFFPPSRNECTARTVGNMKEVHFSRSSWTGEFL